MLQEEMKNALQAKRRTPPAGFEARNDMLILKVTAETKPGRRMPRAAVILCVILAVMGLATTLAATVDMVNSRLHALWPEAAEFLMPVDMSSEAEGIRMEVISAVVKDNKAMITFSLQDLEGDRLSEHTAITSGSEAFPRSDEEQYTVDGPLCLSYDAAEKKGVYAQVYDFEPELISEDYEIPLLIDSLETVKVDDIVETMNHFRCIDLIIDKAEEPLSEELVKTLHGILKTGTSDSRKDWFAVGDYKKLPNEVGGMETCEPERVHDSMLQLIEGYNAKQQHTFEDILDFHVRFEKIHPFQDGNGRVGRLIMFKECLCSGIVPFIITDELKMFYYRGLREWGHVDGYLTDTCLSAQDQYKAVLDYFRSKY